MTSRYLGWRWLLIPTTVTAVAAGCFVLPAKAESTVTGRLNAELLIVNGSYAKSANGAVSLADDKGFFCSASRIAPRWILTAKHCAEGGRIRAYTGLNNTSGPSARVVKIVKAPQGDIALMKLDSAPAGKVLPYSRGKLKTGTKVLIRGWGLTSASGQPSTRLKQATARVTGTDTNQWDGGNDYLVEGINGGTLDGDSGGPIIYNSMVYGALSWGDAQGPGGGDRESGYAQIYRLTDWIQKVTGKAPGTRSNRNR